MTTALIDGWIRMASTDRCDLVVVARVDSSDEHVRANRLDQKQRLVAVRRPPDNLDPKPGDDLLDRV